MKTFSKIILYFVAIAALSWFLPWIYGVCTPAPATDPYPCRSLPSPANGL